jgi:hypothetical protein
MDPDSDRNVPRGLWEALRAVPDHRRAKGRRYKLASVLLIAIGAMLAGRRDQPGIVRRGRKLPHEALAAIGISRPRVPTPSVWCALFRDLDIIVSEGPWGNGRARQRHRNVPWRAPAGCFQCRSRGRDRTVVRAPRNQ